MNIVVKLPDKDYSVILSKIMLACYGCEIVELPKGHGRLIDADELYKQEKEEYLCPNNAPFISTDYAHVFAEIDHAPTIIPADEEEQEAATR